LVQRTLLTQINILSSTPVILDSRKLFNTNFYLEQIMLLILTYIHSRQSIVQTDSTTAIESFEILNEDLGLFKKTVPHLPWFIKPQKGLMPIKHMIKHQ
jgi:hypothetical protein